MSIASDPDPVKKTRASGIVVKVVIRSASASAGSWVNGSKHEYVSRVAICSATASAISRRPWPTWQYQSPAIESTSSLPSPSHSSAPSPRVMVMNCSRVGLANGWRKAPGIVAVWQLPPAVSAPGTPLWHRRSMPTPFDDAAGRVRAGADHHAEAAGLVAQMTLDERLGCLDGDTPFWPGLFDMTAGGYYTHPWPAAHVDRLGIPGIDFADGPRGCVVGDATAFPVSMARGATFDPELEERVGDAIGAELRASGATYTGAVCMNLLRHPAWGRAQETYGEDPHHVGTWLRRSRRGCSVM